MADLEAEAEEVVVVEAVVVLAAVEVDVVGLQEVVEALVAVEVAGSNLEAVADFEADADQSCINICILNHVQICTSKVTLL